MGKVHTSIYRVLRILKKNNCTPQSTKLRPSMDSPASPVSNDAWLIVEIYTMVEKLALI